MVNFAQKLGQLAKNRDYTHLPPHRPILKPHVWFSSSIRGRIKGEYAYRIARGATFPAAGASFSGSVVSKVVRQIPSAKGFLFQLRLSEFRKVARVPTGTSSNRPGLGNRSSATAKFPSLNRSRSNSARARCSDADRAPSALRLRFLRTRPRRTPRNEARKAPTTIA